jgi:hypothetical protein
MSGWFSIGSFACCPPEARQFGHESPARRGYSQNRVFLLKNAFPIPARPGKLFSVEGGLEPVERLGSASERKPRASGIRDLRECKA